MFSHLCRACLCQISDSSDIVPLYESHKNIIYNRLLENTFRLSLQNDQNLSTSATNLCKKCAGQILKSYKFHMMYMESDRKLRKMLKKRVDNGTDKIEYQNLVDVEVKIEEAESTVETSEGAWKCNKCSAGFKSRTLLREHKRFHRSNTVNYSRCTTQKPNENGEKSWKCGHCSCEFRTRQLKHLHQQTYHKNISLAEPSVVINIDDESADETNDFHFADISQVGDDPLEQNEFKFDCSDSEMTTDLGLYLMEKHSQISCFDPLEANNSCGSLLRPMAVKETHSKLKNSNIVNEKWKCSICLENFRTRDILREHRQLHRDTKPLSKLEDIKHKKEDVVNVSDRKPLKNETPKDPKLRWQCQTCSSAFETRDNLRIHRRIHFVKRKSMDSNEWQCNVCLAVFAKRRDCVNHKRTEHDHALSDEDMEVQPAVKRKKVKNLNSTA